MDLPPLLPAELHAFEALAGRWDDGDTSEWWVPAGDVWWSVSLGPGDRFDVVHVERQAHRQVRYVAQPDGRAPVPFTLVECDGGAGRSTGWCFANPEHDHPKHIRYRVRGARLVASI